MSILRRIENFKKQIDLKVSKSKKNHKEQKSEIGDYKAIQKISGRKKASSLKSSKQSINT